MRRLAFALALLVVAAGCVKREAPPEPAGYVEDDDPLTPAAVPASAPASARPTPTPGASAATAPSPPGSAQPPSNASVPVSAPRPDIKVPTFSVPILLGRVAIGAEPSVAVAPDSTIYVTTPLSLWRSDDKGASFQSLGPPSCPIKDDLECPVPGFGNNPGLRGGNDGSLAVADDGTVYWAGLGSGGPENVPFQRSTDRGLSWSAPKDLSPQSADRQWIVAGPRGEIHASWRVIADDIMTSRSRDGGLTWSSPGGVVKDGKQGPIVVDRATGRLFLPHVNGSEVRVARSMDGGSGWSDHLVATLAGSSMIFPIAAMDTAGTLYIVWADSGPAIVSWHSTMPAVWISQSQNAGESWSPARQLSTTGVPALFPWVDAGAPGRVVVAWYEGLHPLPLGAPNEWIVVAGVSTTADLASPEWATGRVTPAPMHVGNICPSGGACARPVDDRSLLDFFEVRIMPDGGIVTAFAGDADIRAATAHVFSSRMTDGTPLR